MDSDYETEEETLSDSSRELNLQQRRPHKGGKINTGEAHQRQRITCLSLCHHMFPALV